MNYEISQNELQQRQQAVLAEVGQRGGAALVLFGSTEIFYLSKFAFIPTERPMSLVIKSDGSSLLFVPRLEHEHAEENAFVGRVVSYPEYPSDVHPMQRFVQLLTELGLANSTLVVDSDGYSSSWGYHGPRLSEALPQAKIVPGRDIIENLRMIKTPEEIALIRESCRWGNSAHVLLQEYSLLGRTESEISMRASMEATMTMMKTMGKNYRPVSFGGTGASAGFRGQIGPNSAYPHAININATLQVGDNLVTGAGARVFGYGSELERTMFVGEPSAEQRRFFDLMVELQDICFAAIKPGHSCSEVDVEMRRFYEEHDLWPYWRHHVGHALGLLGHEAPFLDIGDQTIIQPGMVFSVEPGIFVMGLGGFRHSDTLVVTETGIELLTYYPRDLASLICG